MNDFLPNDYKEPVKSNYMSFEEGDNTFRVLDSATIGYEYWREEVIDGKRVGRPVRVKEEEAIPLAEVMENIYGDLSINFFWAFPVYNFEARKIQILTIKQKTVRRGMIKSIKNPKWGDPKNYNFVVSRDKDESGKTVYTVGVEPKEPLDKSILDRFKSMKIDMNEWMKSKDPFVNFKDENEVSDEEALVGKTYSEKVADSIPF